MGKEKRRITQKSPAVAGLHGVATPSGCEPAPYTQPMGLPAPLFSSAARFGGWSRIRGAIGRRAVCLRAIALHRRSARAAHARAIDREHEVGDARRDLGAEARAVEDAIVSHVRLQPMRLAIRRNAGAQPV